MPPQYKGGNKRPRNPRTDRQTRSSGLGTFRQLLKATGNEFAVRPSAGFLSQVMGIDKDGNLGFPVTNMFRDKDKRRNLGMVDEVLSLPTLVELLGFDPPQFAEDAASRLEVLKQAIRDDMGIDEPEGFLENAGEALGTMGAQLPVPGKKKVDLAVEGSKGLLSKLKSGVKKVLGSAPEFFSPTIDPKASNYLSGAGFGGLLGSLGDEPVEEEEEYLEEEEPQRFGAGGLAAALEKAKRAVADKAAEEQKKKETQFIPSGQQTTTLPPELLARRRQRPNATLDQLFRYGMGAEFNNFFVDPTFGTPVPGQAPVLRPFEDPGGAIEESSVAPSRPRSGDQSFNTQLALLNLKRGLGIKPRPTGRPVISVPGFEVVDKFADGGMVDEGSGMSDPQAEQMATALTNLVAKYRGQGQVQMATGGKVGALLKAVRPKPAPVNLEAIARGLIDNGGSEADIASLGLSPRAQARLRALMGELQGVKPAKSARRSLTPEEKNFKVRQNIEKIKMAFFGESDEPDLEAVASMIAELGSPDMANRFGAIRKGYEDLNTFDPGTGEPSETFRLLLQKFEEGLDRLTPGERIPNPNE